MERIVQLHRKIAPELIAVVEERYDILRHVQHDGPIGRRALSQSLGIGERVVRAQVDFLKTAGLVDFSPLGMTVTQDGQTILADLAEYIRLLRGLTLLETELAERLGLKQVIVVPGDSDLDSAVKRELGRTAANVLAQHLTENMTVAVSGGSTMAGMAESICLSAPTTTVVPARGGLGEQVEYQANIIAAVMAAKIGGHYRLLHIPDGVSEKALGAIMAGDATITSVIDMVKHADILIHSIGRAHDMAVRRSCDASLAEDIVSKGAVGEALGHYCTLQGECVYVTSSVGLRLADLAQIGLVIAVAGGRKKAAAIVAVISAGGQDILVIDEAAAREIANLV
ncbi:MAG: sugar-binding domain-containing protein [Veillonellales bacterium]